MILRFEGWVCGEWEQFSGFGDGWVAVGGRFGCFFQWIRGNNRVDLSLGDALDERRFEAC